jgi:hypothetical protein
MRWNSPCRLRGMLSLRRRPDIANDAIDPIGLCMKGIIAQLKTYIQKNKEEGCHANGEPENIQERKAPMPPEIAKGCPKVILDHSLGFI